MSVSNVNSIYGAQMGSNAGYDTPAIKFEEKESNIGAWLCGGLALVATLGVGIAAHKTGKAISPNNNDDNMFQTIWKGVKSWVDKNGDDVAKNIDDIPAECKTSFKTFFSGGEITSAQKQNIVDNADEISKVFSNKARNNASKATSLETIKTKKGEDKLKALAEFLGIKEELKFKDTTKETLDFSALSADDKARIARKLKGSDGNSLADSSIDNIINGLQTKYTTKQSNYNNAATTMKGITIENLSLDKASTEFFNQNLTLKKRLNRSGAAQTLAGSCEDTSSYINTQNSLTKWRDAGDLTQDEYDNLRALAEQQFMRENGDEYLKYLKQTLKKANGSEINFGSLDEESINLLNNKFKGLKLDKKTPSLKLDEFIKQRKASATSISEYLGLNGCSIPSGWTIENNALHFKGSTQLSPIDIGGKRISISELDTYQNKSGGKITGYTITLENLKSILKAAAQ